MKRSEKRKLKASVIAASVSLVLFSILPSLASNPLLGCWQCRTQAGAVLLEFRSENLLLFAGEPARYLLVPGALRVEEAYGLVDYPYQLSGDRLLILFPDGQRVQCTRSSAPSAPAPGISSAPSVPPPNPTAPPPSSPNQAQNSPSVLQGEAGDPTWGFAFKPPGGWKYRQDHTGVLLGHDTVAGMILVFPHEIDNPQALARQMREGIVEQGARLLPSGDLSPMGGSLIQGGYSGIFQGEQVQALGIGTLSPHGGGAYVLALTTPEKFGREISQAAESIAQGIRYFKPDTSRLVKIFAGRWASYSGSSGGGTLRNYTFHPNGVFEDASETSYSGEYSSEGWGTPDSSYGAVGSSSQRARWTVRGGERRGQIHIRYPNGNEDYLEYQVHVERGQTYWREYLFNGRLFQKQEHY